MSETRYVCPDCRNEFLQPFKCTTCGAQKLYDCTLRSAEERAAELERALAAATAEASDLKAKLDAANGAIEVWQREAQSAMAEAEHWKRMHECAQNANAYRQSAIEGYEQEAERAEGKEGC
ncbi:MAG: hypothetical protein NUV51_03525 [Sulfuricaulis sp.]|nr:hypothetical protein [Sulfuricaulis sp.]